MKKTYRGTILLESNGEEDDLLRLSDSEDWLAERVQDDIEEHGEFLSVRYFTADKELPVDALEEQFVKKLYGAGEAKYNVAYSEITSYLWTDEDLNVGGHDLLEEIKNHKGKFLHLEIEYSKTARTN